MKVKKRIHFSIFFQIIVFLLCIHPRGIFGISTFPRVVQGDITLLEQTAQTLVIETNSPRTVVDWNDFSLEQGGIIQINQPASDSAILLKCSSSLPTLINGNLSSNGKIYVISPSGIILGPSANVESAGFYGLGLLISTTEFIQSQQEHGFEGCDCEILQQGIITANSGDIVLLAGQIINEGHLLAPNGAVFLGSGTSFTGCIDQLDRLNITLSQKDELDCRVGITQRGNISAGHVCFKANGKMSNKAILHLGTTTACECTNDKTGKILVFSEQGKLEIAGTLIGPKQVQILGEEVRIGQNALIQSFCANGGGEILVGGDFGGSNASVLNAQRIHIDPSAHLDASAQLNGDGGKVAVWSEESTLFYGAISAKGGLLEGNGGFVEVSSKKTFDFQGLVDRSAPNGTPGVLLLDPSDILLTSNSGSNTNISMGSTITATASTAVLSQSQLQAQLNLGSVIIQTSSGFSGNGDISQDSDIILDLKGNTLTLDAIRDILISNRFDAVSSSSSTLNLYAGRNYVQSPNATDIARVQSGASTVNLTITAGQDVIFSLDTGSAGYVQLDNLGPVSITAGRDVIVSNSSTESLAFLDIDCYGTGSVFIEAGRNVSASSAVGSSGCHFSAAATPGDFTIIAQENITFGDGVTTTNQVYSENPNTFTLVCDNANPSSPSIGLSGLQIQGVGIDFTTNGGDQIRFFTARRNQNNVGSNFLINGTPYIPGPLFVNSVTEQWETYYPSSVGGEPFTIFYKNGAILPPSNLTGTVSTNRFVGQTEYIHNLRWAPSPNPQVVAYNIYIDGALYATIPASNPLQIKIQDRCKNKKYVYQITAVTAEGEQSSPVALIL